MKKTERIALIGIGVALCTCVGSWFAIGGIYGLLVLSDGKNPLKLVRPTPDGVRLSQQRGDAIVAALEAFKKQSGAYPGTLSELVPRYLPRIDEPVVGSCRWEYQVDANRSCFSLVHWLGPDYEMQGYVSKSGQWHVNN